MFSHSYFRHKSYLVCKNGSINYEYTCDTTEQFCGNVLKKKYFKYFIKKTYFAKFTMSNPPADKKTWMTNKRSK